jgi:hypothetical protein
MGDVERMQSLGKELCGISVPALIGGALVKPATPKQPEPRTTHFPEAKRTAVTIAENQCASQTDARMPQAKNGTERRACQLRARCGMFSGDLLKRQVPRDDNDTAIKVDVLSLQRQEFARAKPSKMRTTKIAYCCPFAMKITLALLPASGERRPICIRAVSRDTQWDFPELVAPLGSGENRVNRTTPHVYPS